MIEAIIGNKVANLQKKSESALSVFRRTISDLSFVNEEINEEQEVRKQKIKDLETEHELLETQRAENATFISKIGEFLSI